MKQKHMVALLLASATLLTAETIVLQNRGDATPVQDTYIEETINTSFSDKATLESEVGTCVACHEKRIFIKFDLSTLPPADKIAKAEIQIYCKDDPISLSSFGQVYLPKKDWKEDEVDWFEATSGEKWSSEGGDLGLKEVTSIEYEDVMKEKWATFDVTETIKSMKSGDVTNRGFVIINDKTDHLYFESSESESEELRPKLVIESTETPIVLSQKYIQDFISIEQNATALIVADKNESIRSLALFSLSGKQVAVTENASTLSTGSIAIGTYILSGVVSSGTFSQLIRIGE